MIGEHPIVSDAEDRASVAVAEGPPVRGAFDPYHKWLGIRGGATPPDHYRLLGIGLLEDDPEVIANAAEQRLDFLRAIRWRQAEGRLDLCDLLLDELVAARDCLTSAPEKEKYDRALADTIGMDWLLRDDAGDKIDAGQTGASEEPIVGVAVRACDDALPVVKYSLAEVVRLRREFESKEIYRAVAFATLFSAIVGWTIVVVGLLRLL